MKAAAMFALALAAAAAFAQTLSELGFTTQITAGLTAEYTSRFGAQVPERFARWSSFAKARKPTYFRELESAAGREAEVLQVVNDAINSEMKWVDDRTHWGADDYWATPAESSASAGGDCEDFSIAKYYLLKELGVPLTRLRITYVRLLSMGGQAHMVLAYYPTPGADPLILDNFDHRVKAASRRADLDPVYTFNDDEVQVRGAGRGKPSQIRNWLNLQKRLVAETRP